MQSLNKDSTIVLHATNGYVGCDEQDSRSLEKVVSWLGGGLDEFLGLRESEQETILLDVAHEFAQESYEIEGWFTVE